MPISGKSGSVSRVPLWRSFSLVVLAGMLLYNPFGAAGFGAGLGIGHSASHRGTVGASELQHFQNTDRGDILSAPDTAEETPVTALPPLNAGTIVHDSGEELPALPLFCANLWFRPPPAR
jgi:hypothetical protein